MLKYRLLMGPPLVLLLLGVIWADEALRATPTPRGLLFTVFMLGVGIAAARELTKIFRARRIVTSLRINAIAIILGLLASSLTATELGSISGVAMMGTTASVVLLISLLYYSRGRNVEGVVASSSATLLAFVYIGLMGGFLILLHKEFSGWVLLGVVLVTKCCDIGAYFTGRAFGRHKLIPWVSPGKTWEGLFGGVIASCLAGIGAAGLAESPALGVPDLEWWQGAIMGAVFGLLGQGGDLVASLLKRDAGMKDYSRALPGFGGVLDVADSPLLVAPAAYWMLKAVIAAGPWLPS